MKIAQPLARSGRVIMTSRTMDCAGAMMVAALFGFAASGAVAAPAIPEREPTKVADAGSVRAAAEPEDDDSANCSKSRKRLWIEGEGWIVRKVTICR